MPRSSLVVVYALVAAVVVLVLSGIIGLRAAQSAIEASAAIARNKDTLLSLERALSAVRDAETGQRGYLLTGKESYLQPYTRALSDHQAALELVLTDEGRRLMQQIAAKVNSVEATQSAVFESELRDLSRARACCGQHHRGALPDDCAGHHAGIGGAA